MAKKNAEEFMQEELERDQQALVPAGNVGLATKDDAVDADMLQAFAGQGNENVTAADVQTQYLSPIEGTSKILKPGNGKYNAEAKQGMILNNVTGALYDGEKGIFGVPVHFFKEVVLWNDGKPVGRYPVDSPQHIKDKEANLRDRKSNKLIDADGNLVTETHYHPFLLVDLERQSIDRCVIAMAGGRIKRSKALNPQIDSVKLPSGASAARFTQIWNMSTALDDSNPDGSYSNWAPKFHGLVNNRALLNEVLAYREFIIKNGVKLDTSAGGLDDENDAAEPEKF